MSKLRNVLSLCVAGILSLGNIACAQFSITPTDSIYATVNADSVISIFTIDFTNELSDSLDLTWRLIEEDVTEGWDYNLCDLGECYTGVPGTAEMMPFAPGENGFLKMLVNPLGIVGHGFWHFWVYPTDDPDVLANVYFDINSDIIERVEEAEAEHWRFGPNPAQNTLYITGEIMPESVQLFSTLGSLSYDLHPQSLDVSGVAPGLYVIRISADGGAKTLTDKILIK